MIKFLKNAWQKTKETSANYVNKLREKFTKHKPAAAFATSTALVPFVYVGTVQAEVPASVTTGITGAVSDVGTIGGLVMGVIIAIVAFVWLKRVLSGK